jgi:phospholipid/cholesterol/gamma-HCH transport system substrate-binding protein
MADRSAHAREVANGTAALVVLIIAVGSLLASYGQLFTPVVRATVLSDRSGLLLDAKADVTMRGVVVGQIRSVRAENAGASVEIALQPDKVPLVASNVTAQIVAPTLFGAKFVDLIPPLHPSGQEVKDGATILTTSVGTETNTTFQNLMALITAIDPGKLDATLGAIANSMQGHGEQYGQFLSDLNAYLVRFNPHIGDLSKDISSGVKVSAAYADASPDLVRMIGNSAELSRTLVQRSDKLGAFFTSFTGAGNSANQFFLDNEDDLISSMKNLEPTSSLLAEYSPIFPCLFASLNQGRRLVEPTVGNGLPGVHTFDSFLPGADGYKYPQDLPKVAARNAPSCYGGPQNREQAARTPYVKFNDGTTTPDVNNSRVEPGVPPLARQLFGPGIRDQ